MNKECIVLSNGNIAITNENGNITTKTYNDNFKQILLTENKIEIMDNKLNKLNKDLHDQEGVIFLSKWMLRLQPIIILSIFLAMFIYGGVTSPDDFLMQGTLNGVAGSLFSAVICGPATVYYSILKPIYKRKANKTRNKISVVTKMKEDYTKELSTLKTSYCQPLSKNITINKPISLIEQTNIIETQIEAKIETHIEVLNKQPKKLVLKRK